MAYNSKTHDTIIVGSNLSAPPVTEEAAAVTVAKLIIGTLYGSSVAGDPAAARSTTTSAAG